MVNYTLGNRIRMVRNRAKLSQTVFAERLGVTPATINRYEKGHRLPDSDILNRMVIEFNCNPGWLLIGEGDIEGETSIVPKDGGKKVSIPQDIKLSDLIDKLKYIYKEGSLDEKIKIRGTIEEVNDAIKSRK